MHMTHKLRAQLIDKILTLFKNKCYNAHILRNYAYHDGIRRGTGVETETTR